MSFTEVLRLAKEWAMLGNTDRANELFNLVGFPTIKAVNNK